MRISLWRTIKTRCKERIFSTSTESVITFVSNRRIDLTSVTASNNTIVKYLEQKCAKYCFAETCSIARVKYSRYGAARPWNLFGKDSVARYKVFVATKHRKSDTKTFQFSSPSASQLFKPNHC
jgi:hypothetical protein